MSELTETQKKVWEAASELQRSRATGTPSPSYDDLAAKAGVAKATVSAAIAVLESRGIIRRDPKVRRSIWVEKLFPIRRSA